MLNLTYDEEMMWQMLRVDISRLKNTGPEVIKQISCPTQLSTKFILLINVKMPTFVGI